MIKKKTWIFVCIGIGLLIIGSFFIFPSSKRIEIISPIIVNEIIKNVNFTDVEVNYTNNNMTIEFKDGDDIVGQATLKSHNTYDEIKVISIGKNKIVVWYEFLGFKDVQKDALIGVEFIDIRKQIENKSYTEMFTDFELVKFNESKILIENPNYLLPIEKDYKFVYQDEKGDWLDYGSFDIPKENIFIGVQVDLLGGEFIDVVFNVFDNELSRHAIVKGTNAGFVTATPSGDPVATSGEMDGFAIAQKHTSPADADTIIEIGWYVDNPTPDTNYEVGIYSHDGVGDQPENRLGVDATNAKGTDAGWKTVTGLNIDIDPSTIYWIALQVDNMAEQTNTNYAADGGERMAYKTSATELPDPWSNTGNLGRIYAFYAVYTTPSGDCWTLMGGGLLAIPDGCLFNATGFFEVM